MVAIRPPVGDLQQRQVCVDMGRYGPCFIISFRSGVSQPDRALVEPIHTSDSHFCTLHEIRGLHACLETSLCGYVVRSFHLVCVLEFPRWARLS